MESSRQHDEPGTAKAGERSDASSVSINSRYFATVTGDEVSVQRLDDTQGSPATVPVSVSVSRPLLGLSPTTLSYLAISRNASIDIYDISTQRVKTTFVGSRRCITALDWSPCGSYLVSGSIDGSLHIWALTRPNRPLAQCMVKTGLIQHVAWSKQSGEIIAAANDSGLYIWDKERPIQSVVTFVRKADRLRHLSWSQHHAWTLLATSDEGRLCIWDLETTVRELKLATATTQLSPAPISLVSQKKLFRNILYIRWISEQAAALLYEGGKTFAVVDVRSPSFGSVDWELGFSHCFEAFDLQGDDERTHVRMVSRDKQRTYPLPGRRDSFEAVSRSASEEYARDDGVTRSASLTQTMTAIPISKLRKSNYVRSIHAAHHQENKIASLSDSLSTLHPESSSMQLPTPSTGRPRLMREDSDSPMPFLSPAIPAKRPSHKTDNILNIDSMVLPGSHSDGYFGSFSSATAHDSDSDDDGFDLKNSKDNTRLMPGGVNVPLPRSCGAVFTSNGNLIMFRPPQVKAVPDKDSSVIEQIDASNGDTEQTARLFPTFGNLFADIGHFNPVPGVVSTYESIEHRNMVVEALGLDKASYNSRESWKPHSLSALSVSRPAANLPNVEVTIQSIRNAALLDQQLARHYRVLLQIDEHGASMCLSNAAIAIQYGREDDALTWQTLAKVVEETEVSLVRAGHRPAGWSDHPFGANWLVRRMFAMAEAHGNLQMLACITAVLLGSATLHQLDTIGNMATRLAVRASAQVSRLDPVRIIPSLRTEFNDVKSYQSSPIKARTTSALSSRGPSLPTTPKLESLSSTPPWSFSSITQSGSKLSFSSSMSPENTRSSFSAAVKSYAQSVSDKFASYGTSPPIRKGVLSPNNELSSSLPGAGSWTKSVSFASTAGTRRASATVAVTDDFDDGYDSDRTVEDVVVRSSPKKVSDKLAMVYKNQDAFSDGVSGSATRPLIPQDLLPSCEIWAHAYAERLRMWRLDVQAVEFDKVGAALARLLASSKETTVTQDGAATPIPVPAVCSICFCAIHGLEQVCPSCEHCFHMVCLGEVTIHDGQGVECPSGCGCICTFDA